jgi:hypothetical protein
MSRHLTYYFRTTVPEAVAAYLDDVGAAAAVEQAGNAFADLFGAKALYSIGLESRFLGITFDKDKPCRWPDCFREEKPPFWGLRGEHSQLRQKWEANWPAAAAQPRRSQLLALLGIEASSLTGHALGFADRPGVLYAYASMPIPGMEEITASQYVAGVNKEKTNG